MVDMRVFERIQMTVDYPEEEYIMRYSANYAPSEMADIIVNFKNANN